jgi:hypothetical protein
MGARPQVNLLTWPPVIAGPGKSLSSIEPVVRVNYVDDMSWPVIPVAGLGNNP